MDEGRDLEKVYYFFDIPELFRSRRKVNVRRVKFIGDFFSSMITAVYTLTLQLKTGEMFKLY